MIYKGCRLTENAQVWKLLAVNVLIYNDKSTVLKTGER
ncbi:hypothetical protein C4J96_2994 [Pseudomonas orientalis]|nr:hypothetical protein C4J96_2994 [Pseudomonas orientalis]